MEYCEALIIGGSAGSLEVLLTILPDLNSSLTFPVVIVLHRKPGKESLLVDLLGTKTKLKVKEIEEKEKLRPAVIYIAPPSYHLLIEKDKTFSLDASEKINFSRPSVDVTFESASQVYGENVVCLLLSGANNDGTKGLKIVERNGGKVIIQNPASAVTPFMPEHALANVAVNEILDPEKMANYINKLAR